MSPGGVAVPGAGRITLVLLVIVPAAMMYPWRTTNERWIAGIAVIVAVVLLSWWRGLHLTTIVGRRLALLRGGAGHESGAHTLVDGSAADARTTVVLRVLPERSDELSPDLPLPLIAEYLDRYGIRCDAVRVTSRDTVAGRTTWIGLTMSAATNLAALQARSATIPLRDTAEIVLRRLADHLREYGWTVSTVDIGVPDLLGPQVKERWRAVQDGAHGYVAAYEVRAGAAPAEVLPELWALPCVEVWTVLQFSGSGDDVQASVACAVRTDEIPAAAAPLPELGPQPGLQRAALTALHPFFTGYVAAQSFPWRADSGLSWHANRVPVRT